ncbi:hypothetical protein ACS0TY_010258 [Phlomoides rotata]
MVHVEVVSIVFLLINIWLTTWLSLRQKGLKHSLSDHYPLLLDICDRDWGPKYFRFINEWLSYPGFKEFVSENGAAMRWRSGDDM